jgi:prephenate dehydrogenase
MSVLDEIRCVGIVGLGLVGGSLARDLSARGVRVLGYDTHRQDLDAAVRAGIVSDLPDDDFSALSQADVIVIAVPVDRAVDVLRCVAPHISATALVTDVGSTKARIIAAAASLGVGARFVGSHPMAGDHRSGWEASRAGLFANARVYLCAASDGSDTASQRAEAFWHALGAHPIRIAADEHDRKLARASHLPHVLSAALGISLARAGVARSDLGPGGRDVTRLAGSSADVWTAIALENAPALAAALADTEREIAEFRQALSELDRLSLHSRFAAARAWFDEDL